MKVGLFFGSFNPVHIGHLIIGEYVFNHTNLEQIWFVLSPQNPLKESKTLLNAYQRLHLLQLAIEDNLHFKATDVEFKLPVPSYTIDTLIYLEEKYTHQFSIIIGGDSFQNISKWKNYEILLKKYEFVIYNRPGFAANKNNFQNCSFLNHVPLLEISATQIRKLLQEKKSVRYMLPEKVYTEIIENKHYQ